MSQSDDSSNSMTTTCSIKMVEINTDKEEEPEDEIVITEPTTIITKEEIETMYTYLIEVMNILQHLAIIIRSDLK